MPRTVVLGTSGAGKTTLARALAHRQGATLIELDELATGPGWSTTPDEQLRARVLAALSASDWVVDGNYERALGDLVPERAELAIWLDTATCASYACDLRPPSTPGWSRRFPLHACRPSGPGRAVQTTRKRYTTMLTIILIIIVLLLLFGGFGYSRRGRRL